VADLGQLFSFEVQQANGYSPLSSLASASDAQVAAPGLSLGFARNFSPGIINRNRFGRLGWGWSDSWDTSLTVDADGSVNVFGPGGTLRRFQPDSRGGYFAQTGDHGTLAALSGGGCTLTELNGNETAYNADGSLNFVQDVNGNRITASYTTGLLTRLTDSSGQNLILTYNTAGLLGTITDSAGRTTTYNYDPSNQYLTSVADFDGQTTSYSYDMGTSPATAHSLLSVTNSDGSHDYFGYDAVGSLIDAHRDNGADDTSFAYSEGQVAVTDAMNDTTTYSFDNRGLLLQRQNPLQNGVYYAYDANLNLVQTTDTTGQIYQNTYDTEGNLLSSMDPLGHSVSYSYSSTDDRLASFTDPNGNTTRYGYDGQGNLTATTYADGTVESLAYDPVVNVLSTTNRRGQGIHYTYDTAGNVLTELFPDDSQVVYTYDAHENLTSAKDSSGTTKPSYDVNDRLQLITYPSGRFLKYGYDAAGRRAQMVDQAGFTVNYGYDAVGRLETLTDGSGNLIVKYTYDTVGRLSRKDNGNGTYTTYGYDVGSELLHLINYAPGGAINSRFDYTYDALDVALPRRRSMAAGRTATTRSAS
jgi:YD repeat-containing protein